MRTKVVNTPFDITEFVESASGTSTALTNFGATPGRKNVIEQIIVHNSDAGSGHVDLRDGAAGAIIARIPLPSAGGGVVPLVRPIRQPTANTALAYDMSAALATVGLTIMGYKE